MAWRFQLVNYLIFTVTNARITGMYFLFTLSNLVRREPTLSEERQYEIWGFHWRYNPWFSVQLRHVVWWLDINVLDDLVASIRVEEEVSTVLRSVGNQPPNYTAQQPRKPRNVPPQRQHIKKTYRLKQQISQFLWHNMQITFDFNCTSVFVTSSFVWNCKVQIYEVSNYGEKYSVHKFKFWKTVTKSLIPSSVSRVQYTDGLYRKLHLS